MHDRAGGSHPSVAGAGRGHGGGEGGLVRRNFVGRSSQRKHRRAHRFSQCHSAGKYVFLFLNVPCILVE